MEQVEIAGKLETFVRTNFSVSASDSRFDRGTDLFERGYVDSVGFAEMLEFLREEFTVEVPEDDLFSDDFTSIDGIARIVERLSS